MFRNLLVLLVVIMYTFCYSIFFNMSIFLLKCTSHVIMGDTAFKNVSLFLVGKF